MQSGNQTSLQMSLQTHMLMGTSGSAQNTEPGQFGHCLWEEAAVSTCPYWRAVMCRLGRQKVCLVWGRSCGAPVAGCPMLGSAWGLSEAWHGGSRGPA